jgi:hypothetical protein
MQAGVFASRQRVVALHGSAALVALWANSAAHGRDGTV